MRAISCAQKKPQNPKKQKNHKNGEKVSTRERDRETGKGKKEGGRK